MACCRANVFVLFKQSMFFLLLTKLKSVDKFLWTSPIQNFNQIRQKHKKGAKCFLHAMAFSTLIFMKRTNAEWQYMEIFSIKFNPYRSGNTESAGRNLFTFLRKV